MVHSPPPPRLPDSWLPWPDKGAVQRSLTDLWSYVVGQTEATTHALIRLETLIVTTSQSLISRLDAATNAVATDLAELRDRIEAAVADKDAAVQAAVADALAGFDAPIARLEQLGADDTDPIPAVDTPPAA